MTEMQIQSLEEQIQARVKMLTAFEGSQQQQGHDNLGESGPPKNGIAKNLKEVMKAQMVSRSNIPWKLIDDHLHKKVVKGCNILFTLSPDPLIPMDIDDHPMMLVRFKLIFQKMFINGLIDKVIYVHEFGKYEHKHLHLHGMIKTTRLQDVKKHLIKIFNTRPHIAHRTLHTKQFRSVIDRERWITYMQKTEQHKPDKIITQMIYKE